MDANYALNKDADFFWLCQGAVAPHSPDTTKLA